MTASRDRPRALARGGGDRRSRGPLAGQPSGVDGFPAGSRRTARRSTSSGQPNCNARLAAIAESRALLSLWLAGLWLLNTSATRPSAKREKLAV